MKRDCPHCNKSMGGRFVQWQKIGKMDHSRNCPICGGDIEFRMYAEEIAARILTMLVAIGAGYWAKERGGGYLMILVVATAVLVATYVAVSFRLRNQQRFMKRRGAP